MLVREMRKFVWPLCRFYTLGAVADSGVEESARPKKFPLATPVGQMRLAAKEMPHKDFAFFYKQKLRLTYRELDVVLR